MQCQLYVPLCISLMLLVACAPVTPSPVVTPTATAVPSPTPIPSPTPTATPIPPLALALRWPEQVSALTPVFVEVDLVPPPGISATATLRATVSGPQGQPSWTFDLLPQEGHRYVAAEPLQLPLQPPEGDWRVSIAVADVQSELDVEGEREHVFRPAPIAFRDLAGALPAGLDVRVPQDFLEAVAEGDPGAGGRAWRYGDGEVALWWAPGPIEPLLLHNAVVMLEATHDPASPPRVLDVEEIEWQGRTAFLFRESWPADRLGAYGGPAEALVVQGPGFHLYVWRVRALSGQAIPPLLRQVWQTFTFVEE